jgi:hypothetical protein
MEMDETSEQTKYNMSDEINTFQIVVNSWKKNEIFKKPNKNSFL